MIVFKCKMCGGTLEFQEGATVATCEYCGSQQSLPKLDSERRANLYDRANHFRRNNEFDKAMSLYETILNEDKTDAEAYWSIVLCRYGIEYVDDPQTHRRLPTVNRTQYTSIFMDEDYKAAVACADSEQKSVYEKEAAIIDDIQKNILAISQNEEAFDVFICYKESDTEGRRTPDSVLANDLYYQLAEEGFKVFFSRITLEDKLGSAYEPYIFAALNSARVMVVIGTRPEYFQAAWVKNEWSRYLALIKNGEKKTLIPAYKDMDPYDLPEEFSYLQAQDMAKLGFLQDLIRGIKKIVGDTVSAPFSSASNTPVQKDDDEPDTAPLIRRAFLFLEDRDWSSADEYCERVLDLEPENAMAYVGKLMAETQTAVQEELSSCPAPFTENNNYQKALRFGDEQLKERLTNYNQTILDRLEFQKNDKVYVEALSIMESAKTNYDYKQAAELFRKISEFKDSTVKAAACDKLAEETRLEKLYASAVENKSYGSVTSLRTAIDHFSKIPDYKDSASLKEECKRTLEQLEMEEEKKQAAKERKQKKKKVIKTLVVLAFLITGIAIAINIPKIKYEKAVAYHEQGEYLRAVPLFLKLENYKDSQDYLTAEYNIAIEYLNNRKYDSALELFTALESFKDSYDYIWRYELRKHKVGTIVSFGNYGNAEDKKAIYWEILEVKKGRMLLISNDGLAYMPYNHSGTESSSWEESSLRAWLNKDFLNEAFSPKEQEKILSTFDGSANISSEIDDFFLDKVFLLSDEERNLYANDYFNNISAAYYVQKPEKVSSNDDFLGCWMREGKIIKPEADYTDAVSYDSIQLVCPAIWVSLD
ncbi:toll/interleukin-1 receptor domain-containing protein [Lacrimispora sp. NSJ-141]|uniref:Toll/interleukin-1 receptor domain-containing protein n=1 Tax=Lientehia hominis TaxID=2897778 RepID=A0AAP2RL57_9FIRM|nr:DUF6273 domain-containing protein [Lientehia hominis]MCD2492863.1 toll/interleukin-1 receptor domain-containing protein [Lientehia hominis]